MKKFLALVLCVLMMISCCAFAEEAATGLTQNVVILFTSDVHCGVESNFGLAGIASVRDAYAAAGNHVLLVDNGDFIQGEPIGTMTNGQAPMELMNAVGYDVAIMGNHEFDYGMDRFMELAEMANFPYISANFNKDGELIFAPYVIKEFDGVKLAFVGATTPRTLVSSTPKYFMDEDGNYIYGFFQDDTGELLYSKIQEAVDAARTEGAEFVILMAHLGNEAECIPYTYADVIANTNGINAVLDGHSHDTEHVEMLNKDGETVLRQGCGTKAQGIGYLKISTDGTMQAGVNLWPFSDLNATQAFALNNSVTTAVEAATEELDEALNEVVAKTPVELSIYDPEAVKEDGSRVRIIRNAETNLGDLCADAYRFVSGADVAVINGGGIRVSIDAGDVTRGNILKVHPFGNAMCVCEATGAEILDLLEFSVSHMPGEFGGFQHVSGLTYDVDLTVESPVVINDDGILTGFEGDRRVSNVMIAGEPIDPEKTYTLASTNYLLQNMGDGCNIFTDNVFLQENVMLDNQVLITYITKNLNGVIGEEYSEPYGEGRLNVINQ